MSETPSPAELGLAELPGWLRTAVMSANASAATADTTSAPSALDHRDSAAWSLLLDSALVASFLPKELGPTQLSGAERQSAESILLDFGERTYDGKGARWSLPRRTRGEIIDAAFGSAELNDAIARTRARCDDIVTLAILNCVEGKADDWRKERRMEALEALHLAIATLSHAKRLTLPPLPDLERELELRRLLAPFKRMTGATDVEERADGGTSPTKDRFFGRADELRKLRSHVNVAEAKSAGEAFSRFGHAIIRRFTGHKPLVVWGGGGVGKTTLVAKFMLEHARAAENTNYPFAYLDFDRATLSPRNRAGLLIEISLQVGAQFAELTDPMFRLRRELRETIQKLDAGTERESISHLSRHLSEFRRIIDAHLAARERFFSTARPFLLVFDTFELVQSSEPDVVAMEEFVGELNSAGGGDSWARLRLVVAGRVRPSRGDLPDDAPSDDERAFLGGFDEIALGPLDADGSADMLLALAADAGAPFERSDAEKLVAAIANAAGKRGKEIQPLHLRLVGELFKTTKDGAALANSLTAELNSPSTDPKSVGNYLIDEILVRRILGAVGDARVRALADPGLVVRRITPDVIRDVMAKGTSQLAADGRFIDDGGDSTDFTPWKLEDSDAKEIFDAFAHEVTLVARDGDALRHRQDVRLDMLPLIRTRRPRRFAGLHELAYEYYQRLVLVNRNDTSARSEALYHGLWLEKPLDVLDALWAGPGFDPHIDPAEFDPEALGLVYLRAKSVAALRPEEIGRLPAGIVAQWLAARSPALLLETDVNGCLRVVRAASGEHFERIDDVDVAANVARLLLRSGEWESAHRLAARFAHRGFQTPAAVSLFRTDATLLAKAPGAVVNLARVSEGAAQLDDPVTRVEVLAHAALGLRGHDARLETIAAENVEMAARLIRPAFWRQSVRILRLYLLTVDQPPSELLSIYFESIERLPRERGLAPTLAMLIPEVLGTSGGFARELGSLDADDDTYVKVLSQVDEVWRNASPYFARILEQRADLLPAFRRCIAFEHGDWVQPLAASLQRTLSSDREEMLMPILSRAGFLESRLARARGQSGANAHVIVSNAKDQGRLLPLAQLLSVEMPSAWQDAIRIEAADVQLPSGPVGPIARALLDWHARLLPDDAHGAHTQKK